ncbi:MAG TPA: glycosyltransferase family 4 protein [Candidatus Limnocylindrales bacterium]|nr:glycosyltransferase family 4 protein [Candidatus Limnocylindrales bacterium]
MAEGDAHPHVVMLVRNPYTHDTRVEKEARTLRDAGYSVTVVCHAAEGLPLTEERDGIAVRRVPRPSGTIPGIRFLRYASVLRRALEEAGPDILHAHDSDALGPVAAAAKRLHRPFVYDAHELWLGRPPRDRGRAYRLLYRAWYGALERRTVPKAAAHITVSPPIARHLKRRYGIGRVELVANYPEYSGPVTRRELRELTDAVPSAAPIILHLGAYLPDRGLEQVVEALRDVPGAHLVLLGAGDRGSEIVRYAAGLGVGDRVHPLPPVPSDDVTSYAASATIGIAPILPTTLNNAYSLPNKLFQYMAAGLPVVASNLPQMREIVEGSGAGVTVDSRDITSLSATLRELLGDRDRLAAMGDSARRAVEERYNWDVSAGTLRAVYERVANRVTRAV